MKKLFAIILFVITPLAQASYIDYGNWIEDSGTGLDWLKLTETTGVSYDDRGSISYLSEGWRYASLNEIEALFVEFGGMADASDGTYISAAQAFLDAFGPTFVDVNDSWLDYSWGFSATPDPAYAGNFFTPWVGVDDGMFFGSDSVNGIFALTSPSLDTTYASGASDSTLGHWLVRTTAVPEPHTALLLLLGLVATTFFRQGRKK